MPIVLSVNAMSDGFGDLLFGLKMVASQMKKLKAAGLDEMCYLAVNGKDKARIQALKADKEFGVQIIDKEKLDELIKQNEVDYFMVGPMPLSSNSDVIERLHKKTPLMYIPEYDYFDFHVTNWHRIGASEHKTPIRPNHAISTGLHAHEDKGIFVEKLADKLTKE